MKTILDQKSASLNLLRHEVEESFGKKIVSSRDCIQLSEEIFHKTSFKVNSNTLRRFYGLVKAEYPPSGSTLNILSKYCGFSSIDELLQYKLNRPASVTQVAASTVLHFLASVFQQLPLEKKNESTFEMITEQTIYFLQRNDQLIEKFQRSASKIAAGRYYYFEQAVNIDALNQYYAEGLRHYLSESVSTDSKVFAYSVLLLKAWLTDNAEDVQKHNASLGALEEEDLSALFSYKYYLIAKLCYTEATGENTGRYLNLAAKAFYENDSVQNTEVHQDDYIFALVLLLIGCYDEALKYANQSLTICNDDDANMHRGLYHSLSLVKALALIVSGKKDMAEKVFARIRPSQFHFLTKKLNGILYLKLEFEMGKAGVHYQSEVNRLIEDTGFKTLVRMRPAYRGLTDKNS